MRKRILSAFAMSLLLISLKAVGQTEAIDDFLGLESEILPELKGKQEFTSPGLHQKKDWQVRQEDAVVDKEPLKGQRHSLIPWSELDVDSWLSIDKWIIGRKIKDTLPDWKMRLRDETYRELMGKLLVCRGKCLIYRGVNFAQGQHLSEIREGDELKIEKGSIAWVFLLDGTIARLGSETSLSFQEMNLSKEEAFLFVRLNQGHVYWHSRSREEFTTEDAPETDAISLPLMVRESNQEFFERQIFQAQDDVAQLQEVMTLDESAVKAQLAKLNELRIKNNKLPTLTSRVMLVAPNATIMAKNASFDFIYTPGGKSYFKKRSTIDSGLQLQLRGYTDMDIKQIEEMVWHEVDASGRISSIPEDAPGHLTVTELLTKRIKTIELAREIWFDRYTGEILQNLSDQKKLAVNFGYKLWGIELERRTQFLMEYNRRLETTNLKSLDNLLAKLEKNGEKVEREITDSHYRSSLTHYLLGLKSRYNNKKNQIREMNDLQYYVWILKNGKI